MSKTLLAAPSEPCEAPGRSRRRELLLAGITLLWALVFVGATRLIKSELLSPGALPWLVAAAPCVAAVFVLVAYMRFLREADELQRLIQLQALALGFGGGFFTICGYSLFERVGAPPAGVELATVMPVLYALGVLLGERRYR